MEENNHSQNIPLLCRKGCGFYGSPNFDGFCSKCHRSMQAQSENSQSARVTPTFDNKLSGNDHINRTSDISSSDSPKHDYPITSGEQIPPVTIKISGDCLPSDSPVSRDNESIIKLTASNPELQADSEVAAAGLSDLLSGDLKTDSKPGSPASTCSSTGTVTKKRPRCAICHKRVGLTGFTCRCGGLYCSVHRYSDTHNCSFDYRESGQEEIRRSNPQIICQKVQKI